MGHVLEQGARSLLNPVRASKPFDAWGRRGAIVMFDINLRISGLALDELAEMGIAEASGR
jgi:hypothetical protein